MVVVKKTLRYSNVFFYNHLCRTSLVWNIIMVSGKMTPFQFETLNLGESTCDQRPSKLEITVRNCRGST